MIIKSFNHYIRFYISWECYFYMINHKSPNMKLTNEETYLQEASINDEYTNLMMEICGILKLIGVNGRTLDSYEAYKVLEDSASLISDGAINVVADVFNNQYTSELINQPTIKQILELKSILKSLQDLLSAYESQVQSLNNKNQKQ